MVTNITRREVLIAIDLRTDASRIAYVFYLRGERGVGLREFLESEARDIGDDVINARLEARGDFARDVVLEFVGQVAAAKKNDLPLGGVTQEEGRAIILVSATSLLKRQRYRQ